MKITLIVLLILSLMVVLITSSWNTVSSLILPNTQVGLYNRDFFENLLVEIHGTIFDIAIVGVLLFWFDKRRDIKDKINETAETLKYLKYYRGDDASYKVYGTLKKLLELGEKKIAMPDSKLNKLKIDKLELISSNLIAVDFSNSTLSNCSFEKCEMEASQFFEAKITKCKFNNVNLQRAKLINSQLKSINFQTCDVRYADFKGSELQSADFRGVDCTGISFKDANLRSANFIGAKNLTKEMIKKAKDYAYIKGIDVN